MPYFFSEKSKNNLIGVHPILVNITEYAITISEIDFAVIEGVRDAERQKKLVESGKSQTNRSYHRIQLSSGFGQALDIVPLYNGLVPWEDMEKFKLVYQAMKKSEIYIRNKMLESGEPDEFYLEWGGNWKEFIDAPHFQLILK